MRRQSARHTNPAQNPSNAEYRVPIMSKYAAQPTKAERTFDEDEIFVSKTDVKGRVTYANDVFLKVALYAEHKVLNEPHSLVRHPDMPRCVSNSCGAPWRAAR